MRTVVIDCDPGVDDAVALLWALAERDALDVRAITVVAGNVPIAWTATNACRIATLAQRTDIAIHAGCARPLVLPLVTAEYIHGDSGLDGADLPPAAVELTPGHGVDRLIELAQAEDALTICAMGPLTNVAMALVKAPEIAPRLARIVLMGGAIGLGNVTPSAEFNVYVDPHAAKVVFESGVPVVMTGLDVAAQVRPTPSLLEALRALENAAGHAVAGMLGLYAARAGGALYDPLTIAYLLMPEAFAGCDAHVDIVTEGLCRGRTVVDRHPTGDATANAFVLERVDGKAVVDRLVGSLGRLP